MKFRAVLCALLMASAALPAAAQQQPPRRQSQQQPQGQTTTPARGEEWYRGQLVELSEVLGGAHYLRIVCDGRGDQRWRDYMRGVIQREPQYNGVLVEGFNRGYRQEEARFPVCDQTTRQMEAELRARGLRIAQGLSARHAGQ
ncbi:MAG: TIGR02301 family protein [Hyphomonadaceae bacterium]